jgi:transcriptional regulator GlxA family with amidase domain
MSAHRVVMFGFEGAQILDVTGPLEVFARTSRWLRDHRGLRQDAYTVELVAARAGLVTMSNGLGLQASRRYTDVRNAGTLLVAGGIGYEALLDDRRLREWLVRMAGRAQRVGSICTGAMLLASAGLLDGLSVTTHWNYFRRLAALAPRARIQMDAIYVQDGNVYTSAGVTAGMDMALAIVEADWGKTTALAVAQELVMFLKRPGGQSQFSGYITAQMRDDLFGALQLWIHEHLDAELSVEVLAARANMSVRNFGRLFRRRLGSTPAQYVRRARLDAARRQIEGTANLRLKAVARRCGFADEQQLRRAFRVGVGVTPAEYRARFAN